MLLFQRLEFVVRDDTAPDAPPAKVAGKELPKNVRQERQVLTEDTAREFMRAIAGHRHEALWATLLMTGMRPAEVIGLRWTDIAEGRVHVQRVFNRRGGARFEEPKTGRSRRSIPLPPVLVELLERQRVRQAKERLKAGARWQDNGLVFATRNGTPFDQSDLRIAFKALLKKAGLPNMRVYDLRHTQATLLLKAGESPKVVAERLGHSSVTLTLDTYSHVLPDMQEAATAKLQAIFG